MSDAERRGSIILRSARTGSLAMIDQAVFAIGNFIVWVVLGRWMAETEYGAYSVAFSIFLLVGGVYNVLLLEPLSIMGANRLGSEFSRYLRLLLMIHVLAMGCLVPGISLAALALDLVVTNRDVKWALLGMGLSHGFILLFWLMRQAAYVKRRVDLALVSTGSYSALLILSLSLLISKDLLNVFSAFLVAGIAGTGASLFLVTTLHVYSRKNFAFFNSLSLKTVIDESWNYGRWMLPASAFNWVGFWGFFVLAGGLLTLQEVGGMKAAQNLTMPLGQSVTATQRVFVPWASRRYQLYGVAELIRTVSWLSILLIIFGMIYAGVLLVYRDPLLYFLYGEKYMRFAWVLPFFLANSFILSITSGWMNALKIMRRGSEVFALESISAIAILVSAAFLIERWGLGGVCVGIVISGLAPTPMLAWVWISHWRQSKC